MTDEVMPTATLATRNSPNVGASPAATRATAVPTSMRPARARFSSRSPSGSRTIIPAAYPSCVAVTTTAAEPSLTPNVRASRSSSGWA